MTLNIGVSRYVYKELTPFACIRMRVAAVRRCARPGISDPGRPQRDLPRTAAIERSKKHFNAQWLAWQLRGDMYRTCTSVSPFFAVADRGYLWMRSVPSSRMARHCEGNF